ncbi:CLIP domain-containing serine protease 14D isoform X1 [Lucilia sericata]|uniref:CLIP domain-containing serine protease 14D isoform X1 n=1 Tax=Lucilia sericata TaxID=13632 RepID=UPI0018A82C97|nr:CLIP domain-containing serine protease 14D isoform X1 [Lucilia sericata]
MFKLEIKINLNLCFCLLLANCVSKVVTYPTQNLSLCNCILLQSCEAFNTFIDNSPNDAHIKAVIQEAVCYFDGISIFVCCPDKINHKQNAKEKPKLDYIDELTGLNCPPSFGHEYNYDEYLKAHDEIETKYYDAHSPNTPNYANNYGAVSNKHHEQTTPVICDPLGNCDPSAHPHTSGHLPSTPQYPSFDLQGHHEHVHHHHHLGHDVPFFPHTHSNNNYNNNQDYPMQRATPKPEKSSPRSCGILPSVSGGNIEVFPWITRLAYLNTTSRTIGYRCMGTIINEQHVLTAAHCVDQLVRDLRLIYVRIGDETNFEDYQILETIVHPNYNEPLFNNDVALLRIAITSESKGPLIQICLPQTNSSALTGDTGVVAGWSSNGISTLKSSTIRYINLPIMNNTECAIRYAKYSENFEISIVITPTEFCAKAEAMNDVCEGDSGGPFMERSSSGRYTLIGIVAFGPKTNCGQSNLPGVYMRVSSYVDWIKSNIII